MIAPGTLRSSDFEKDDSEKRLTRAGMAGTGSAMAGKWPVAARLCNRKGCPSAPGWILGAAIDRRASSADAAAGASSAGRFTSKKKDADGNRIPTGKHVLQGIAGTSKNTEA